MAEISTYKCSNRICSFVVRISADFPVWHSDTPKELRSLTVRPEAVMHVIGRRDEVLCSACHSVVEYTQEALCTACNATTIQVDTQSQCPRCKTGIFSLTNLSIF